MRILALAALTAFVALPAAGETLYQAPQGCKPVATLRLPSCLVKQVATCSSGNIVDHFKDSSFLGRAYYDHPSLFIRFDGVDGRTTRHIYGESAPRQGVNLSPGDNYTYTRDVERTEGQAEPGDTGTEVMKVGDKLTLTLDTKRFEVLDIHFTVTNPETGYDYRERALMLTDPMISIGAIGATYNADGSVVSGYDGMPESISLEGQPGFRSQNPASSCHVSS